MENDFERMTLEEKQEKLKDVVFKINEENSEKLKAGEFEVSDISYYRSSNGKIFYRVETSEKDENGNYSKSYELYEAKKNSEEPEKEKYEKVDLAKYDKELENIENYQDLNGYNENELEEQKQNLQKEKVELEELRDNPKDRNSLSNLEKDEENIKKLAEFYGIPEDQVEEYAEINGEKKFAEEKEAYDFAKELGIKDEDIDKYTKVDENGKKSIDANKVNFSGIQSGEIEGNEKVTTYYSLNKILGKNYDTYKIIKTPDSVSHVFGVTKDGDIEEIDNDIIKLDDAKNMSLIENDGTVKNVGVMVSFYVKMPGSSENGKELIGMYNDNGNVGAFYARRELDGVAIGKGIEKSRSYDKASEYQASQTLDYRKNKEINGEADSAFDRTYDGCATDISKINSDAKDYGDFDSLIQEYSEMYGINEDELRDLAESGLTLMHEENFSDKEIAEGAAIILNDEKEREEEQQEAEEDEPSQENEDKEDELENTEEEPEPDPRAPNGREHRLPF